MRHDPGPTASISIRRRKTGLGACADRAVTDAVVLRLPAVRRMVDADVQAAFDGDPSLPLRRGRQRALARGRAAPPYRRRRCRHLRGRHILGRIRIGSGSVIGGNAWLTRSVPPGSRVHQVQARQETFENGSGIWTGSGAGSRRRR